MAGALVVAFVLALLAATPAAAAPAPVRILSPAKEELVTGPRLAVRIKVRPGVSHVRLQLAGRSLKLGKATGADGVRVASIGLHGLPSGRVALELHARRDKHPILRYRRLILGHHTPYLLRHVGLPRHAAGAVRLGVRLGGRISNFRLTVNGQRAKLLHRPDRAPWPKIDSRLWVAGAPTHRSAAPRTSSGTIRLSADDGLHPGRNRIVVLAYHAQSGNWARVTRTVWMSPRVPLVAAGQDRSVATGASLRLDGRASRPVHADERLHYRWQIVSQPRLPRSLPPARLLRPGASRPRLEVHRPGNYKVALRVHGEEREQGARGKRAVVAARSFSGVPDDVMNVEVADPASPYGVHLTTNQPTEGGATRTTIEGSPINPDGESDWVETPADEIRVIKLDRVTRAVDLVISFPGSSCQIALIEAERVTKEELAIVTGAPGACGGPWPLSFNGEKEIPLSEGFTAIFTSVSLVGYNVGHDLGSGPGAMTGVLRAAPGTGLYTYVPTELVPFDTYVEGKGETVSMSIAGQRTSSVSTAPGQMGIELAVANPAFELIPAYSQVYHLQGTAADEATLNEFNSTLVEILDSEPDEIGDTVMVQTFGDPKANTAEWEAVGRRLEELGGTAAVWDGLDGSGNYALVTGIYSEAVLTGAIRQASTVEASGPLEGGNVTAPELKIWVGTARGALGRGQNSSPVVSESTSLPTETVSEGPLNPDQLVLLAESEPHAWPLSEPPYEAALGWISKQLGPIVKEKNENEEIIEKPSGLGPPKKMGGQCFVPSQWDVRSVYCNVQIVGEWKAGFKEQLQKLDCPSEEEKFTSKQCEAMIEQLEKEFRDIGAVHELISNFKEPFKEATTGVLATALKAGKEVSEKVVQPDGGFHVQVPEGIFKSIVKAEQDAAIEAGEAAATDGISLLVGGLEGALSLGFREEETADGPADSPFFVQEKEKVGEEAVARLEDAVAGIAALEDLLVSDWTKLSTIPAYNASIFAATNSELGNVRKNAKQGAKRWLYETLMQDAYGQITVAPSKGATIGALTTMKCERNFETPGTEPEPIEEKWHPFSAASASGVFASPAATSEVEVPTTPYLLVIANTEGKYAAVPAAELTEEIFEPLSSGGAGLYPAPFFTWVWAGARQHLRNFIGRNRTGKTEGLNDPESCEGS